MIDHELYYYVQHPTKQNSLQGKINSTWPFLRKPWLKEIVTRVLTYTKGLGFASMVPFYWKRRRPTWLMQHATGTAATSFLRKDRYKVQTSNCDGRTFITKFVWIIRSMSKQALFYLENFELHSACCGLNYKKRKFRLAFWSFFETF